jgi:hypothetical protein
MWKNKKRRKRKKRRLRYLWGMAVTTTLYLE